MALAPSPKTTETGYESWLLSNMSAMSTLESSLRSLTWFLPGRFKDAELASEALAASLNLVSMYHDTLLAKVVQRDPKYRPLIPSSLHTRFTRAWSDKNTRYKWAARSLELIRFTELVLEMTLRRKVSPRNRWRSVVLLELIKALLRVLLLRITRRPLLSPPIPERDFDPSTLPTSSDTPSSTVAPSSVTSSPPATPTHLRNNHVPLPPHPLLTSPPHPAETSPEDYLLPKALTTSSVKPSHSLLKPLSSHRDWLAEVLYILRPLVYVSLLVSDNKRSSRPLVSALILEFISRNLRRTPPPSASLERSEYARRDRDMVWYLLRGSIWESYTKPKLESLADMATQTPLLGLFGALVKDWVPLIDEYYYYTAP
ncbi:peroxisomal membrane protein PEX16 [Mycena vitilis]|nr:peroxisomal membrane protein PEX16 [Mycena vitilis]